MAMTRRPPAGKHWKVQISRPRNTGDIAPASSEPARARDLPPHVAQHVPVRPFSLDADKFAANLRSSRKETAGGPSGMTNEHLRPLLDNPRDMHLFCRVAELLARGDVPEGVALILGRERITALQKLGGGVRAIAAGDVVRRLVARTIAQQLGKAVEVATAPFPVRTQAWSEVDPESTVLSIDGISTCDLISRRAMLSALARVEGVGRSFPSTTPFPSIGVGGRSRSGSRRRE